MIQSITIRNFKQFDDVEIPLGETVVFVGPNNSGKTSALQALSLWNLGLKRWKEKRGPDYRAQNRSGVVINRRDMSAIPVPSGRLIWRNLGVRKSSSSEHIHIEIVVSGVSEGISWTIGLLFDYTNEESFYVRPSPVQDHEVFVRDLLLAARMEVAYMPPMSGLTANENLLQAGTISVLVGQGQTAQVLRNLCYKLSFTPNWERIVDELDRLFGLRLKEPTYVAERGEITLSYNPRGSKSELDISSSGRGFQQTLLLLAYISLNENAILLLDEPDAHLEVLRQRQIFELMRKYSSASKSQIIAASHSEIILQEAADSGRVVAFLGKPHDLTDKRAQLVKALTSIGWEDYFLAEQKGWILYVEDSTDLRILKEFAKILNHPAEIILDDCFVHYLVTNLPQKARDHFFGLKEAKPDLVGFALFDRLERELQSTDSFTERMWGRREIENYFTSPEALIRWVGNPSSQDLFSVTDSDSERSAMTKAIQEVEDALRILGREPWSRDVKASDEVLSPIFARYFALLGQPVLFRKSSFSELVKFVEPLNVDPEVWQMLDDIADLASRAKG